MKIRQSLVAKIISMFIVIVCAATVGASVLLFAWSVEVSPDNWQNNGTFINCRYNMYKVVHQYYLAEQKLQDIDLDFVSKQQLTQEIERLSQELDAKNTNFRYEIYSKDGQQVIESNLNQNETLNNLAGEIIYATMEIQTVSGVTIPVESGNALTMVPTQEGMVDGELVTLVVGYGVIDDPTQMVSTDAFYNLYITAQSAISLDTLTMIMAIILPIMGCAVLFLLWAAGYRRGIEGAVPSWQEKIPLELYLFTAGTLVALGIASIASIIDYLWYGFQYDEYVTLSTLAISTAGISVAIAVMGTMALCTLAVRLRCRIFWKNTLVYWFFGGMWKIFRQMMNNIPVIWRAVVAFAIYICVNFFARYGLRDLYPMSVFLVDAIALAIVIWWTLNFRKVRDGADAIASGNLTHRVDSRKMPLDLKEHAESINNISVGMETAVDSRLRSERFKAELITNVSHDLKTPLTSIINYVDLLKTTEQTDPHAVEYIEVLDRKSQRLKKLTEDLVEASKASTGALHVEREKIGVEQLLDQAIGEYLEKLENKGLSLVTSLPDGESYVLADGRHLWRVVDNLLGNCVKYAMEGTRVYLDLARKHGQVVLSIKNISKEALTANPEQLVERFVRGDEARTSEGSGLGLSIAKSLTELQGGTFEIAIDGDLFKATITLPQAP